MIHLKSKTLVLFYFLVAIRFIDPQANGQVPNVMSQYMKTFFKSCLHILVCPKI